MTDQQIPEATTAMCECAHHWYIHAASGQTAPGRPCWGTTGNATPGPYEPCHCTGFRQWTGPRDSRTGEPVKPITLATDSRVGAQPRQQIPEAAITGVEQFSSTYGHLMALSGRLSDDQVAALRQLDDTFVVAEHVLAGTPVGAGAHSAICGFILNAYAAGQKAAAPNGGDFDQALAIATRALRRLALNGEMAGMGQRDNDPEAVARCRYARRALDEIAGLLASASGPDPAGGDWCDSQACPSGPLRHWRSNSCTPGRPDPAGGETDVP